MSSGLEVGDLGRLLVVVGLELIDLGQEDLPLVLVLLVLGLEVGRAVRGGLGLDVDLLLGIDVGRSRGSFLRSDVVGRQLGGQQREVLHQLGRSGRARR